MYVAKSNGEIIGECDSHKDMSAVTRGLLASGEVNKISWYNAKTGALVAVVGR